MAELRIKVNAHENEILQRVIDTATRAGILCSRQDAIRVLLYLGNTAMSNYEYPDLLRVIRQELGE